MPPIEDVLLTAYRRRWDQIPFRPIAVETEFAVPLRSHTLVGRVDLVGEVDGVQVVVDHKTASSADAHRDVGALGIQAGIYFLAYPDATEFWASVLVKPRVKPRDGETIDEYLDRVDVVMYDVKIKRERDRMISFYNDLLHDLALLDLVSQARLDTPNPASCQSWGRPCEWAEVCQGLVDLDDLSDVTRRDADLRLVSASRLTAFKSCSRKHALRYVHKLERRQQVEALEFGTKVHAHLESYWKGRMQNESADSNPRSVHRTVSIDF